MKKRITSAIALIIFSIALVVTSLISTNSTNDTSGLKTGLAISTSIKNSKDASTDADGVNSTSITVAAVTVDTNGKVVACEIDVLDATISFNTSGLITSDLTAEVLTKTEQGDDYGMAADYNDANTIGKEWYEQVDAFEDYCIGKTAEQIMGITVNAETLLPENPDLAAGCTMHPAQFQYIVADAIKNASVTGANADDKLGIALSTKLTDSKDATATPEEGKSGDGLAEVAATIAVTTVDANGKVTSAIIDAVQADVTFDVTGKITNDLTADILTKNEKQDGYGMKEYSSIQKEWFEQAASFAKYCVGKTADEITGIAVNDETGFVDGLETSCTMHPGNFQYVVADAIRNAQ